MRHDRHEWPGRIRVRGLLWRDGLAMVYAPEGTSFRPTGGALEDTPAGSQPAAESQSEAGPATRGDP